MMLISTSFISLESLPKPSKLLPSSCPSNAEQSLVSSSRTADGIIQFFRDVKLRHCVYQVMSTSCLIWNWCFRNNLWCGSWFCYRFSCNFIVQCFKARRRILINRWLKWYKYQLAKVHFSSIYVRCCLLADKNTIRSDTHVNARYTGDLVYTNKVGCPFQLQNLETGFYRK